MMDGGSGGDGTGNGLDGSRGGGGDGPRTRIKSGTDSYRSLAQHQTYPYKVIHDTIINNSVLTQNKKFRPILSTNIR